MKSVVIVMSLLLVAVACAQNAAPAPAPAFSRPAMSDTPRPVMTNAPSMPDTPRPAVAAAPFPSMPDTPRPAGAAAPFPAMPDTPRPAVSAAPRPAMPDTPRPAVAAAPRPATSGIASPDASEKAGHFNCSAVRCRAATCAAGEKAFKQSDSCCETCQPQAVVANACKVTCRTPKCAVNATLVKSEGACCACCRRKDDDSEDESHLPTADTSAGLGSAHEERNCTSCDDASDNGKQLKVKLAFKNKDSFENITTILKGDWQGVLSLAHSACNAHVRVHNMTMDSAARTATITYALFDNKCAPKVTPLSVDATIDTSAYTEDAPTVADSKVVADVATENSASAVCVSSVLVLVAALALLL